MKQMFTLSKLFFLTILLLAFNTQVAAQNVTINWGGTTGLNTLTGSRLTGSKTGVTVGTKTIDITYSISYTGNAPTFDDNGTGNVNRTIDVNWSNLTSTVTLELTFSKPVAIVTLPINDVDYDNSGGTRSNDRLEITGSNGGNTTNNILQFGATVPANTPTSAYPDLTSSLPTFAANVAGAPSVWIEGENTNNASAGDDISILTNSTLQGITKLVIVFKSGPVGGGETNPGAQSIQFLPFIITSAGTSNAPLPVTFANVSAKEKNGKVGINWSNLTESEINYYEVERSSDAVNFTTIAKVSPKANNFSSQDYSFTDANPNTVNFYRIKAVEFAGTSKTTVILKVSSEKAGNAFQVYPNPVKNKVVTIQTSNIQGGIYSAQVLSTNGQVMMSKNITFQSGSASQSFELSGNIRPGTYLLKIENGTTKSITTLFVQ